MIQQYLCLCVTLLVLAYTTFSADIMLENEVTDTRAIVMRLLEVEENEEHHLATIIKTHTGNRKRPFSDVQGFMGTTKYAAALMLPARTSLGVLQHVQKKNRYSKWRMRQLVLEGGLAHVLDDDHHPVFGDMTMPRPNIRMCPYPRGADLCDRYARYRTIDGSCNNLRRPYWGKAMRAFRRLNYPDYGDGFNSPREARSGAALPSARAVSLAVHMDQHHPSNLATVMHMTVGQFLDHDVDRTAITKLVSDSGDLVDVECGETGCNATGIENSACFPIPVSANDSMFEGPCLQFVRSANVLNDDCATGFREQLNQITSYIDCSMVYGSDKERLAMLRDKNDTSRGKMATVPHPQGGKPFMPVADLAMCRDTDDLIKCFVSGDTRTNEQAPLSAIHTIYVREHNRIEEELHKVNPHWDGERLFQETRKVLIASWQHIVYNEYLPALLGPDTVWKYGLRLREQGFFRGYNRWLTADTSNVFATAAFRCGHSQVTNEILLQNAEYTSELRENLAKLFFRPKIHYEDGYPGTPGMDSVMMGQASQHAEKMDRFFASCVRDHMFTASPPHGPGTDLAALNIQRGRDHGLAGYTTWRRLCGLSGGTHFYDLVDIPVEVQHKFRILYESVDDIDLYPAAMSERHLPGAMVGPTLACLLGHQFSRYRVGDRFWYESWRAGFTRAQLTEIRKVTFARQMCDNLDSIKTIQKYTMLVPKRDIIETPSAASDLYALMTFYQHDDNERRPCDDPSLGGIDFAAWKENPDSLEGPEIPETPETPGVPETLV